MDNRIDGTRLRRAINEHADEHPRPEVGNAHREQQKDRRKNGSLDRGAGACATKKTVNHSLTLIVPA
jgi:hypothetical protein